MSNKRMINFLIKLTFEEGQTGAVMSAGINYTILLISGEMKHNAVAYLITQYSYNSPAGHSEPNEGERDPPVCVCASHQINRLIKSNRINTSNQTLQYTLTAVWGEKNFDAFYTANNDRKYLLTAIDDICH